MKLFTCFFCFARMKGEMMKQSFLKKTHLAHGLEKTENEARYDENVKTLLSDKQVYCARMISEQLDREFTADNYDGLKKVYSIWIFFEAPERDSDTITEYSLEKKDIYGKPVKAGKYDYLSISFVRLSTGKKKNSKDQLINMLDTLFSDTLKASEKKYILEKEHQMSMTRELEGGIEQMCNVSLGIRERALVEGIEQGAKQKLSQIIQKKIAKGQSVQEIAEALEEEVSIIQAIVRELNKESTQQNRG